MKKLIILFLTVALVGYIVLIIPTEFNHQYEGVKFRLGESEKEIIEEVILEFKGEVYRNWKLEEIYIGSISINDYTIPGKDSINSYIKVYLNNNDWNIVSNGNLINGEFHREFLGELFISKDGSKVAVTVWEDNGWYGKDGLMIAAPAKTRIDGLSVANDVMKEVLMKPLE